MNCPKCHHKLCDAALRRAAAAMAGAAGRGKSKARTTAQARAAAQARWSKVTTHRRATAGKEA